MEEIALLKFGVGDWVTPVHADLLAYGTNVITLNQRREIYHAF
jgi:hypothetical protein